MSTKISVGDTVRVLKTSRWHKKGDIGKVSEVDGYSIRVNDRWISPYEVEMVPEKPKAKSQEIELEDVQKGDLIVAFWNEGGVETRKKGVAYEKDVDGDWSAEGEGFLTHANEGQAEHIYLIERPEVKGFDALDKTKKYILKGRDGVTDFMLEVLEGNWMYGWVGDNTRVNAKQYEKGITEGNGAWDKPVEYKEPELADGTYWVTDKDVNDVCWWKVEVKDSKATWGIQGDMSDKAYADYDYLVKASKGNVHVVHTTNPFPEPTNLEKFEQAGYVGNIYIRPSNTPYKVTDEGRVMVWYKWADKWADISWGFPTFHRHVECGALTKIS